MPPAVETLHLSLKVMAPRAIWKGHITFGLVNIPVTLYSAENRQDVSFHLIDSRDTRRVRYQRVNEDTGEEVPWDCIVKGYEYSDGQYVLLSGEEMQKAAGQVAKTIEIEDFVDQEEIDPMYFDKPYYLEPGKGGRKSYALLRETLRRSEKLAVAQVAIRSREHLACLMVRNDCLVLELMRFPAELRLPDFLDLPSSESGEIQVSKREVDLALQLVESMSATWEPSKYKDAYRDNLMKFIQDKVSRGELQAGVAREESDKDDAPGDVVDLMDYLEKSLKQSGSPSKKTASKKKAASKSASSARKGAKKRPGASKKSASRSDSKKRSTKRKSA